MKIALHSDLHTEVSLCELQGLAQADVLLLAGDIGDMQTLPQFFYKLRKQAPQLTVLYILGNHEHWYLQWEQGLAEYRRLAADYDIRLLENESLIIDDVLFCGTTLWTDFALAGDAASSMDWARDNIPDFHLIQCGFSAFSPENMLAEHQAARQFLHDALTQHQSVRKKVVFSHFLPAKELVGKQYGYSQEALMKSAYWSSDLPELYALADVWAYGHSHENIECMLGHTRFISNQRGYFSEYNRYRPSSGYRPDFMLEI